MNRLRTIGVLVGVWTVCLWGTGFVASAVAQEDAVEAVSEVESGGAKDDAGFWERLIYVPFKNLQMVFNKQGSSVLVPYEEYIELWKAAQAMHAQPTEVPAVITEAGYVANIDQDVARITAELSVQVLGEGWTEVPVTFGQAALGNMTASNENVLIRGRGEGQYGLLFPEQGKYTVTLELLAKVQTSPDGRQFDMQTPSVAITTMEVVVPDADQTIDVKPQQVVQEVDAAEGQSHIKATLGSTQNISVTWHPRASTKPEMELLASVTNQTRIMYDDGIIRTDAFLTYEVLRGELQAVRLAVPVADRILDITSPDAKVKGWQSVAEEDRQVITVEFLSTIEKQVTVEVHTERSAPTDSAVISGISEDGSVSGIHAMDAVRESGQLVVGHSSTITLAIEDQSGLIRVAAEEIAEQIRIPNALYFKFYSPQYTLEVTARPVQPHVTVAHHTRLEFRDDEIRIRGDLNYTVEQAGIFDAKLKVPEGVEIERVDGPAVKEHTFDESSRVLTVVFNAKIEDQTTFTVTAKLPLESEEMMDDEASAEDAEEAAEGVEGAAAPSEEELLLLPILEPLNVAREDGSVAVYAPDSLEIITDEQKLIAAQPDPAVNSQPQPGYRLASAWVYHRRPVEIWVRTTRRPTRLLADVGTVLNVKEEIIEVAHRLTYTVQYAGIDTFVFSVPTAVADKVQIRSLGGNGVPAIKQQSKASEAVDGWVKWTVVLQRDHVGAIPLEVTYDIKAETKQGEPTSLTYAPLRVHESPKKKGRGTVSLSRIAGEIAVQKARALSVSASPATPALEPIDIRELQLLPADGSLAYRYFSQPVELKIEIVKHDIQEVVQTVVSRELVEIVASKDDQLAHRVRLLMKTSERQRLRIDLPAGVQPLSILVDGKPVTLEKNDTAAPAEGWMSFFLNVSRTKSSDEPFNVTLQYLLPATPQPFDSWGGQLTVPLPRIGGADAAGVAVQQLKTVVWIPDEFAIVSTPDEFTRDERMQIYVPIVGKVTSQASVQDLNNWIGQESGSLFDFPTAGHAYRYGNLGGTDAITITWWNMSTYSWILSAATVIIGWILIKTSWETKLGLLLILALVGALAALKDPNLVMHVYAAMRYGLFVVLALWILHSLLNLRRPGKTVTVGRVAPLPAPAVATATVGPPSEGQLPPAVIPPPGTFDEEDEPKS